MGKREKRDIVCDVCNKKLRSRYRLKLHMAVHTGEKNYVCGLCKKAYQQKWNLVTHVARVHSMEKPFKCNDCGKAFGYSSHFKRHVKTHFLEKIKAPDDVKKRILNPYECGLCGKSFESNYRLESHSRIHTGTKPFICDKCGKHFVSKRVCAVHLKKKHPEPNSAELASKEDLDINRGLFPEIEKIITKLQVNQHSTPGKELIPCEVCGKSITRNSLQKHLNIHHRSRIYSCRFCKKEFLESSQRMVHERKHTGEKPYLCDLCGRGHAQYGNLLTHRKRFHNLPKEAPRLWKENKENPTRYENSEHFDFVKISSDPENVKKCNELSQLNAENLNSFDASSQYSLSTFKSKPKYTGNETIEEFLKIATSWANKKFKESKQISSKKKTNSNDEGYLSIPCTKESDMEDDLEADEQGSFSDGITDGETENLDTLRTDNTGLLKDVKKKINYIIYEKIVKSLQNSSVKTKVLLVVDKINEKKGEFDPLREFFKLMKTVPDNEIMIRKENKIYWHCWLCRSKLRSRHLLARHLIIHEPEENRPFKCEICHKTFTQSNNYKEHVMSHRNEYQYYCEKCGRGFRHKSHFNMHMKRHGSTPLPQKYECAYCGKKVHTNHQKIEHERTHTKEKPYLCKICGQQFAASSTLNNHLSTHAAAKHQCAICLKFFKQKSSLKRHYNTHSKYPYNRVKCECGKTFSQSPSLKKHKMICKNRAEPVTKPFPCINCCKRFLTKSDLQRHVATHDSSKRFTCSICSIHLKTNETLKRHLKRHDEPAKNCLNPIFFTK